MELSLDEDLVFSIYSGHVNSISQLIALKEYLMEGPCIIGSISLSIVDLIEISGKNTLPSLCDKYTIRYKYGAGLSTTKSGLKVIKNAIHRPKSIEQNYDLLQTFANKGYF